VKRIAAWSALGMAIGAIAMPSPTHSLSVAGGAVGLTVTGSRQVVFDWSRQACSPSEEADLPARAFRDASGRVQLLLSHFESFRMTGSSLDRLRLDCHPVMRSALDPDPAQFRDRQWLAAVYRRPGGRRIWALVHDEYQGYLHPHRCPQGRYAPCWYNAITLASSTSAGRSFRGVPGRRGLVAAPPYRYRAGRGPSGLFAPTNLVPGNEGYVYFLARFRDPDGARGTCAVRSRTPWRAASWRAWDGERFAARFLDPYVHTEPRARTCRPVSPRGIGEAAESLVFVRSLGVYLLVGAGAMRVEGRAREPGIYFSSSTDLVHWRPRQLLLPGPTVQTYRCGGTAPIAYPALLDPDSESPIFATSDSGAYLYLTRIHYRDCHQTPDRDLVRIPVRISRGV
jgi:hypothetical protein